MTLTITINMDNDAFQYHNGCEARRILRQLAEDRLAPDELEEGDTFTLMDYNGNRVGEAKVTS